MTFIEGIGDEVTAFFVIIIVIVLATLVTFIGSGPHLYSPVHNTRAVTFALVPGSRERTDETTAQSTAPPNTIRPHPNDDINQPFEQYAAAVLSPTPNYNLRLPPVRTSNVPLPRPTRPLADIEIIDTPRVTDDSSSDEEAPETDPPAVTPSAPSEQDVHRETPQNVAEDVNRETPRNVAPGAQNASQDGAQSSDAQGIRVRLKYLDDTERTVRSSPVVKIGDFKRNHFAEDLANNKVVRLIYCGHLLRDNSTLQSYRVIDNSVLHVQVLQAQGQGSERGARSITGQQGPAELLDLSHLLWPLVTLILGVCWACYIKYPEFFSVISVSLLFVFTASFFVFYRHVHQ